MHCYFRVISQGEKTDRSFDRKDGTKAVVSTVEIAVHTGNDEFKAEVEGPLAVSINENKLDPNMLYEGEFSMRIGSWKKEGSDEERTGTFIKFTRIAAV